MRRSCSISSSRSAASSLAIRASTAATSLVGALAQELELVLVVELLEHVGLELLVLADGLEDLLALLVRGGLDEVGDLGGVQPGQAPGAERSRERRDVPDERLDLGPRARTPRARRRGRESAAATAGASARPQARVDPGHAPRAVLVHQLDLARRTSRAVLTLIRLRSEHVGAQQHLARPALELGEVELGRGRARLVGTRAARCGRRARTSRRPPIRAFSPITGGSAVGRGRGARRRLRRARGARPRSRATGSRHRGHMNDRVSHQPASDEG